MADETGLGDGNDGLDQLERKFLSGRRIVMMGVPAALVLVLCIVGLVTLFGGSDAEAGRDLKAERETDAAGAGKQAQAYDPNAMPVFCEPIPYLVNLNSGGARSTFLQLKVQFEVPGQQACDALESLLPRIKGDFQNFLRELRPEDLSGSASAHRLKEELLVRVNRSSPEARVLDVHIVEFLVQ